MFDKRIYDESIAKGNDPKFAMMCATRKPPGADTDKQFFSSFRTLGDDLPDEYRERVVRDAKKNGYNPQTGDTYMPNLARFRGDPEAFISRADGRSKIKKVCEQRGWSCHGKVNAKGTPAPPPGYTPIADDLVAERVRHEIAKEPEIAKDKKEVAKLAKKIRDKHSPSKRKGRLPNG